jgi:putative flippase GtrA
MKFVSMKFVRYFVVGGIAAVVDIGGFLWLAGPLHMYWFAAACVSFTLATLVNYVLSVRFVFDSGVRFRKHQEISLVFLISLIGLACNQIVLGVMIMQIGTSRPIAKLVATGAVFFWNYGARKHFVFSRTGHAEG